MTTTLEAEPSRIFLFREIPMRVVKIGSRHFVPVIDLAEGLGVDRQNITRTINKYREIFDARRRLITIQGPRRRQEYLCLDKTGVYAVVLRLEYLRIKNPAKRSRIIRFQRWAMRVLATAHRAA